MRFLFRGQSYYASVTILRRMQSLVMMVSNPLLIVREGGEALCELMNRTAAPDPGYTVPSSSALANARISTTESLFGSHFKRLLQQNRPITALLDVRTCPQLAKADAGASFTTGRNALSCVVRLRAAVRFRTLNRCRGKRKGFERPMRLASEMWIGRALVLTSTCVAC
jgi:hypothetical protein